MTLFGKIEIKREAFDHCPMCQKKLKKTFVPDELWNFICAQCYVVCSFRDGELQFSLDQETLSEEEFERMIKLRSFQ